MQQQLLQHSCQDLTASNLYVLNMLQNVVDAISSASFAMQELAKEQEHIDKHTLHKAVEYFLDQIEVGVGVTQLSQAVTAAAAVLDSSANLVGQAGDDPPCACCTCCLLQEAQKLVLAAIQSAAPDRDFESNFYFTMLQVG